MEENEKIDWFECLFIPFAFSLWVVFTIKAVVESEYILALTGLLVVLSMHLIFRKFEGE